MSDHIQELIESLQKSEAYSHSVDGEVKVIHTAISVVFLTGSYAYKISKPVNFGFLDFSSLEKRKVCYDKEVKFNSLISPELYLGVVAIARDQNNSIKVGSTDGEIIEYAIKMKQCKQNSVMKELLKENKVSSKQIIELAKIIAAFHQKAPMSEEISNYGKMENMKHNLFGNFEHTVGAKDILLPSEDYDFMKRKMEAFLENNSDLIASRVEKGHIKHCHGDLHSGNVFIEDGEIIIFDGIVFNKEFPNSDTISDLAFMLMDLEFFGHKDKADLLLETYQEIIQDRDMDKLLTIYKCYRAYVRGKIQFFIYSDPNVPEESKDTIVAEGKKYFELARKYAEEL